MASWNLSNIGSLTNYLDHTLITCMGHGVVELDQVKFHHAITHTTHYLYSNTLFVSIKLQSSKILLSSLGEYANDILQNISCHTYDTIENMIHLL